MPKPEAPRGIVIRNGDGEVRTARGSVMHFKATAATSQGRFSLMDRTLPPNSLMPAAHRHPGNAEAFWVLEGEVTFHIENDQIRAMSNDFVLVPAAASHTFGNESDAPARLLVLHVPALDAYFSELEALWSGDTPPDHDSQIELMRKHGMEPA